MRARACSCLYARAFERIRARVCSLAVGAGGVFVRLHRHDARRRVRGDGDDPGAETRVRARVARFARGGGAGGGAASSLVEWERGWVSWGGCTGWRFSHKEAPPRASSPSDLLPSALCTHE
eukprot:1073041-Pleurochrysis_carterae.AAC.1